MSRTVHRLETKHVFVDFELEHVFRVVLPVTGFLPELGVEHVGRADWYVSCGLSLD